MFLRHTPRWNSVWRITIVLATLGRSCLLLAADEPAVEYVNLNIPIGGDAYLPCQNATPGYFYGVSWSLASADAPHDIYSYLIDQGTFAHVDRASLFNETSLVIRNVTIEDGGSYHCNLIYFADTINTYKVMVPSIVNVNVILRPKAYITPTERIVTIGDDVILTCRSVGSAKFNVTWTRNDSFDLSLIAEDTHARRLRLKNVDSAATGIYNCLAENLAGRDYQFARVIVKVPPTILPSNPVHINVEQNGQVDCIAKGYPQATFKWQFISALGDQITLESGEKFSNKYEVTPARNTSNGLVSSLVLKNVNKSDFRLYTCLATNSEGVTSRNLSVVGFAYPQKPIILNIRTSGNKAIVMWNVAETGGTELKSLTLQYRNETGQEMWKSIQIKPATVRSYTIMDLEANTKYEFRMFATNAVGDSPTSATITMWTKSAGIVQQPGSASAGGLLGNLGLTALIGIVAGAFLALFIAVIIVCLLVRRLQKTTGTNQTVTPPHSRPVSMENGSSHGSRRPSTMPCENGSAYRMELEPLLFQQSDQWEFPRNQLRVSTVLGSGAFGMVMRGEAHGIGGAVGPVKVAIKMVRDSSNDTAKRDLQAELDVLKLIAAHSNVVGLRGCCSIDEPLMVIVEYCANGDLQGFLRSSRGISERYYRASYGGSVPNLTSKMLLTFACQIARGMSHLSSLKVIHRDLAARNVLVDDRLVCKVSDFGFARDVYVEDHYMKKSQGGRFPIKWMAIESLIDGISTTKSDVWSFGVVLWEIVTLGASPYPGMNSYEVVSFLQDGYRMEKPKHCSDEVYRILLECWNVAPQRRPSFNDLSDKLYEMAQDNSKDYVNMSFYQDHLYENFDVSLTGQSNNTESESMQQQQQKLMQPQTQQQVSTDL